MHRQEIDFIWYLDGKSVSFKKEHDNLASKVVI